MEGRRGEADHTGEEMGEEPRSVAQEGALTLYAPQLLKQGEGYDLRVRQLLQARVAPTVGVNVLVDVVHQAEQNGHCLVELGGSAGVLELVHRGLLGMGRRGAPVWPAVRGWRGHRSG